MITTAIIVPMILVLVIQYFTPFIVFSAFTLTANMKPQVQKSPLMFILGIVISKLGITLAFVLFFALSPFFKEHWLIYGLLWLGLFIANEIGNAVGPKMSKLEAIAGAVSYAISTPLSLLVITWFIK